MDRTTNELQKALTAKQADLVQDKEISLFRSRMVMRKILGQINELRAKVALGDEPASISIDAETERQRILARIAHITDEVEILSQRLQNLRREEARIEGAIRELKKAQKEGMH